MASRPKRIGLFEGFQSPRAGMFRQSPTNQSVLTTEDYGEVDLRNEFDTLVFGSDTEMRHGHLIVIRHLRRNSSGVPTPCQCKGEVYKESDPDCSYCGGEGYLWDENWYQCYSTYSGAESGLSRREIYLAPGSVRVDYRIFFLRYDTPIEYGDKIVEMKLDEEGEVVVPYIRRAIYKPQTIQEYRSDNGRIEYIKVYCREEDAIRPDVFE